MEIQIVDVPDREDLVIEIWSGDNLLCEINKEKGQLEIEFFKGMIGKVNYSVFMNALEKGKKKLLEED